MSAGFCTHSKHEVAQETKSAVFNTAKPLELFVRQLISVEFRVPPDDEPVNAVREPRQVATLPMISPMRYNPVPRTVDGTKSVRMHKLLEEFDRSGKPSHVLVLPPRRARNRGILCHNCELTGWYSHQSGSEATVRIKKAYSLASGRNSCLS